MRLDADLRQVAEAAQTRRRAAAERVKRGEIEHFNFMSADDCYARAQENLEQIIDHTIGTGEVVPGNVGSAGIGSIADAVNYALAVIALGGEREQV